MHQKFFVLLFGVVFFSLVQSANAQTVKVTPLGARTGEFCSTDRALLFEDPGGVRILYDPGNTIAGAIDPRLGDIHVILVSHAHGDHLGNARLNQDPSAANARCDAPAVLPATPVSNTANIAAAKKSAVLVGFSLGTFINRRMASILGTNVSGCIPFGAVAGEIVVPRLSPCTSGLGISGKATVTTSPGRPGVRIAMVPALHDSTFGNEFLTESERTSQTAAGLPYYVNPANGYVLTFSNGLAVYLSGDTGLFGDMRTVLNEFYGAKLAVINIGDIFTTGPEEAADAVNRLIKPRAVIPSHANEVATGAGNVNPATRTARFITMVESASVHVPRSGLVMEFDGTGKCSAGCVDESASLGPIVSSVRFDPPTLRAGGSFTAIFSGRNLTDATYFDVRFSAPGSTTSEIAANWQQGTSGSHAIPSGITPGVWIVTGVRAHESRDDHTGPFVPVTAVLTVIR